MGRNSVSIIDKMENHILSINASNSIDLQRKCQVEAFLSFEFWKQSGIYKISQVRKLSD